MPSTHLWNKIIHSLKEEVSPQTYKTWFDPLNPTDLGDKHLVVEAPDPFIRDWIEENYLFMLNRICHNLTGKAMSIQITVNESVPSAEPASLPEEPSKDPAPEKASPANGNINPKYTFGTFVVGASNQFAHAAAMAVAEQPAKTYNPLFLYGGVGLGKTHLMHAIGHYARSCNPSIKLHYLSSESFMNDLINSLRFDRMSQFREMYRTMDILLVDDIQFIAGKERTQEEFFHTFNTLFDSQKQIIVSSDKFPREIPDLEERLRSRFEWGLIADIQPPDLETKVAILKKKAELSGIDLPSDVCLFLAENTTSNIRELEGYLLRIIAFSTIKKTTHINKELVQEALKDFLEKRKKIISTEQIQRKVSNFYNTKISDLKSKRKHKALVLPRHIAMYLSRLLTDLSLPEIGRHFGGRDHTTVLHAIAKIERLIKNDSTFEQTVNSITKEIEEV